MDRCLLRGLRIMQRKKSDLTHVAQTQTLLLQSGAKWNSDVLLDQQKTLHHIICESPGDHHELLDLMIKSSQGAIIDMQDVSRFTAFLYAVRHANIECLKCLIANRSDVNIGDERTQSFVLGAPHQQWCPILQAIKMLGYSYKHTSGNAHADIFDLLLESGIEVNTSDFKNDTSTIVNAVHL